MVTSTRPLAAATCASSPAWTLSSEPDGLILEDVGRIADQREHALVADRASALSALGASPSTGVSSIFQSPVWKMLPNGVSISSPLPSGIECDSGTKRDLERPELDGSRRARRC